MRPVVLCLSGLDPSGGAGLQADIETVAALGGHAAVVCTALTVQDSQRVHGFVPVDADLVIRQAETVLADLPVAAIKLGMLGSPEIATAIGSLLGRHPELPVVLDPVLAANSGGSLAAAQLIDALLALLPRATLVTPNTLEARCLAGTDDLDAAVATLLTLGAQHILLTGGHEPGELILNRLFRPDGLAGESRWPRLPGEYHGSGCTLAAGVAAALAAGLPLAAAVARAEAFVAQALARADQPHRDGQRLPRRIGPAGSSRP